MIDETVTIGPQRQGDHVDAVGGPFPAQRDALPVLVQQTDLRVVEVEMPSLGWQVHRLERAAPFLVHHPERLHHTQEVLLQRMRAGAPTALQVAGERGSTHRAEDHAAAADGEIVGRVARRQRERRGRVAQRIVDQTWVEADDLVVHGASGGGQVAASGGVQDPHTGRAQHLQRGRMDVLDVVVGQHAHGFVATLQQPKRGHARAVVGASRTSVDPAHASPLNLC